MQSDYPRDMVGYGPAEIDPGWPAQAKIACHGLHCRLVGRPGRIASLARFLDYVQSHADVWVCRRIDIAEHWRRYHCPPADQVEVEA